MATKCPKCHTDNPETVKFCGECGTQLILPEGPLVSKTLTLETKAEGLARGKIFAGRYEVLEELGGGGMGKVYRVYDRKLEEEVALKLIRPEIAADRRAIERFRNEIKISRKITHRNVCRMHDLGEAGGTSFITMEYVRGEDLKSLLHRTKTLPVGTALSIARQVAEGLSEAHGLGVVHRDLKPGNIMIDKEGNAKIMDFGIARSLLGKGLTGEGAIIGTPEYMSPEQVEGKEADQRSDVYSLGVILYEMVTGRVPFEGDTPFSIALKHKTQTPQNPRRLNSHLSEDLGDLILICIEKKREKRYQTAEALVSDLRKQEEGLSLGLHRRRPLTSKGKKLFIPALAAIGVVFIGIVLWRFLLKTKALPLAPSEKLSLAIVYFDNNTGDARLDYWRKALSDLLIADLSQSKYLDVLSGDRLFQILAKLNQLPAKSYSSDVLRELGSRGGMENILRGSYSKAGDTFRVDVMLQRVSTGEVIGSERVEGRGEESLFSMVDELTRKVKTDFNLPPREIQGDIDKDVREITTSSPEAFRYLSEGERNHSRGDYHQAIRFYERAIAIDSGFAMAYIGMAKAYNNLGYFSESRKSLQKAFKLSDRLPDKGRYYIQAEFYRGSEKTYDKAIEAYQKLLPFDPNEWLINTNLAVIYIQLEEWDKGLERLALIRQNEDKNWQTYFNSASIYMAQGLYEKARAVLVDYLNNVQNIDIIRYLLASDYLCQGKFDIALVEADKAFSLDSVFYMNFCWIKGDIYHCQGDLSNAEKEYQKLLGLKEQIAYLYGKNRLGALYLLQGRFKESEGQLKQGIELAEKMGDKRWESDFHLKLGYLYLRSANPEKALEECDKARNGAAEIENLSFQVQALNYKGLALLEIGSVDEAQKDADELMRLTQSGLNKKGMRNYHHLQGMIEQKRANFSKAIENFKEAISLLPSQCFADYIQALFIDSLASAYYRSGDLKKALQEYEKITTLTTGRLLVGDIYAKSFYMLGKIAEEKAETKKSHEHYQRFIDLWQKADPGQVEVEDARKRLAGLNE